MPEINAEQQHEAEADLLEAERFEEGFKKFTAEGAEASAAYIQKFRDHIGQLSLTHFQPDEFLFLGGSHHSAGTCGGLNEVPPEGLWDNINKTAEVLDQLRSRLGVPIRLTSIYRNKAYNNCLSGAASNSFHMQFKAADFKAGGGTPTQWRDELRRMRDDGVFQGGIGLYSTFVHVDTRGTNADWTG